MKFAVSATLDYEVIIPSTLLLCIQLLNTGRQKILHENFKTTAHLKQKELSSVSGERNWTMLEIPAPGNLSCTYTAHAENNVMVVPGEQLYDVPIPEMPASVLPYLNPSRYCQSDRLYKFAAHKFGHIEHAYDKVLAVCDWIHSNVEYSGGYTTPQTSAFDTITEQVGVCRDFAHLGIALCRALTIPARYFTCYAYQLQPQDFHACFEAYLGGHWIVFDATRLVPLNGLLKITTGADAAESAFASSFGNIRFKRLEVQVKLLEPAFQPADIFSTTQGFCYS